MSGVDIIVTEYGWNEYSGTRTRVDVRRVPSTAGLPGYLVFITMDVSYAAK